MKTAISIPDDIFKEVDHIAKTNKLSISEVFTAAIIEYLKFNKRNSELAQKNPQMTSKQLFDSINNAFPNDETNEDIAVRHKGKRHFMQTVLKERY